MAEQGDVRSLDQVGSIPSCPSGCPAKTTLEQFRAQIGQEIAQWRPLIREIAEKK
jgi:hypothetical protein